MAPLLVCVLIWFEIIIGSQLLEIPADITNYIFSHFDIIQKAKCIPGLNKDCNKYFNRKHQEEISQVKQLKEWFAENEYTNHLDEIGEMSQKLKMSELYHMNLPQMLSTLQEHWISDMRSDQDVTQTLHAMKLHPLGMMEFNTATSSLSDPLRLLLLASRALVNYFVPNVCANTFVGELEFRAYTNGIAPFNYWSNFIWLRPDPSIFTITPDGQLTVAFQTDLWPIYLSYLYEFYFSSLDKPHFALRAGSVFHLEGKAKSNLLRLINDFGLIPWTLSTLEQIRNDFHSCDVHEMYADFHRIDMSLHYINHQVSQSDRYTFRTYLIIRSLEDGHCSIPDEFNAQMAFKWDLVDLCFWNWNTYRQSQYDMLVQIISGFVVSIDPFVAAFVASYQGNQSKIENDSFGCDLMYRLWEANGLDLEQYEGTFKQLVINGIINRAKYYWCINSMLDEATEEISRLGYDERLFDANTLNLLISKTKDPDTESDFLVECLLLLTELRSGWDYYTAMEAAKGILVKEILILKQSRQNMHMNNYSVEVANVTLFSNDLIISDSDSF